jgi:hypothetical protein
MGRLLHWPLWCVVAAPALFLLLAVQASAITVPFWDHAELISIIDHYYSGTLEAKELWRPHNHSRPFTYRTIYLANAILTRWDIRSEYLIHLSTIFGAFLLQAAALRKLRGGTWDVPGLACLGALSILAFSPVGHNNHWWSMMTQLTLTHLLIFYAFYAVAFAPHCLAANARAMIACWLATYTLTNGLVAACCCAVVAQLAAAKPFRIHRFTILWGLFIVVLVATYMPGLPKNHGAKPPLTDVAAFALAYVGMPLRGLLDYPYANAWNLPRGTGFSATTGAALVLLAGVTLWRNLALFRAGSPGAWLGLASMLFAGGSALLTAWGRAGFDDMGADNGNSSRYSIYGAYLLAGMIYVWGTRRDAGTSPGVQPAGWIAPLATIAFVVFVGCSARAYAKSIVVYKDVRAFNNKVVESYSPGADSPAHVARIFPKPEFVADLKQKLHKWQLGPYRAGTDGPWILGSVHHEFTFATPRPQPLSQPLEFEWTATTDRIVGVDLFLSTYGRPNPGRILVELLDEQGQTTDRSSVAASKLVDNAWQLFLFGDGTVRRDGKVRFRVRYVNDSGEAGIVAGWIGAEGEPPGFRLRVRSE